jgi:hypothetical protein
VRAVTAPTARRQRLAHARQAPTKAWRRRPVVDALPALRGVPVPGAVTIVADLGARTRVETPRPLLSDGGLPPSDESSGERRQPRGRTPAGQSPARRALIEGAWADRDPAKGRRPRQLRLEPRPQPRQDRSGRAPGRRCQRSRHRPARGQHATQVVGAIARARMACRWAIPQAGPLPASTPPSARAVRKRAPKRPMARRRGAAPVWGHPRAHYEAATTPRTETAAGTRRPHVRGEPTPGDPPAPPSSLTGSAASGRQAHPQAPPGSTPASVLCQPLDNGSHSHAKAQRRGQRHHQLLIEPPSHNAPLSPRPLHALVSPHFPRMLRDLALARDAAASCRGDAGSHYQAR